MNANDHNILISIYLWIIILETKDYIVFKAVKRLFFTIFFFSHGKVFTMQHKNYFPEKLFDKNNYPFKSQTN